MVVALLCSACSEQEPTPPSGKIPPDVRSAYVDLYLDDSINVCGRQLDAYDQYIERIFELWTGEDPSDFRARVHVLNESACPGGAPACADPDGVYLANRSGEYHELAHAMHFATDHLSAPSIVEGLAEALGPRHPLVGLGPDNPFSGIGTQLDALFETAPSASDYGAFALFTRFLLDRHGADAYRAYFQSMADAAQRAPEDFQREFELAFGERLDSAWSEFISESRCAYDFWYCDERRPVELPFTVNGIACHDPDSLGFESPGQWWPDVPFGPMRIVHLVVSEPTTVRINAESVSSSIGRCGDCSDQRPILSGTWPVVHIGAQEQPLREELELEPGTYAFIVTQPTDRPAWFSIAPVDRDE